MDIERILSQLTTKEKVDLLVGASIWTTAAVERLGIPSITVTDGPHGVRLSEAGLLDAKPATAFPVESAMASTWNPELVARAGSAMASECREYGVAVLLGPGVNGKRSPLGGRNFEYFSEDPHLSGVLATAFISGVQSGGVGTSLKHFVGNEQEKNRMSVSSKIDERALHELYLRPFEMAVRAAKPWTVMCAYNAVNGVAMANNSHLLNHILKGEWGYDGVVVSDWGAVRDKVASVANGLDLEMPGPGGHDSDVLAAIESGIISIEVVDDHVRRILRLVERANEPGRPGTGANFAANHEVAREVAAEGAVLLTNDGILPLSPDDRIAVVGAIAERPRYQGSGSSHMNPSRLDTPLEAIRERAEVVYAPGYDGEEPDESLLAAAMEAARDKQVVVVFIGTTERMEEEGHDRSDLSLPKSHLRLLEAVVSVNPNVVTVTSSGSAIDIGPVEGASRGVLHTWLPGQGGGTAVARLLFGELSPSGRLSETFPAMLEHNPSYLSFPGTVDQVDYREGIFSGYRYYDTRKLPVLHPFGHGLSYTTFEYSNLELSAVELEAGTPVDVSVTITNTGSMAGKEVVQVYVHDEISTVPKPTWELKGFTKVAVEVGESRRVTLSLDGRAFEHYCESLGRFATEAGTFIVGVGASSRDIRISASLEVSSNDETSRLLTMDNDITDWTTDGRYAELIQPAWRSLRVSMGDEFAGLFSGMPVRMVTDLMPQVGIDADAARTFSEAVRNAINAKKHPTTRRE